MKTASIGGSGTWGLSEGFPEHFGCDVSTILNTDTPFGTVPTVKTFEILGQSVLRIPIHGWHLPVPTLDDTLAVFWLLHEMGIKQVVTDASVGGIRAAPWDVVIPDDVRVTDQGRLAVARLGAVLGINPWVRMKDPFCGRIRQALVSSVQGKFHTVMGGTYYTTPLSVFETEFEVSLIHATGATVVGQTCGQEAACARLLGMCYGVINPVANYAEGLGEWTDMGGYYASIAVPVAEIIWETLEKIVGQDCDCTSYGVGIDTYTKGE